MLEGPNAVQIAISACIVLGAFIVRGMPGFGAGMIGVPLLAFLMPVHTAVSLFGLVVIYLHMRKVGRAPFRATVAALWLFEMIARIVGYGAAGYYTADTLLLCALLLPLMCAGSWLGERIGNRISQETFSKVMASLLLLAGGSLLAK